MNDEFKAVINGFIFGFTAIGLGLIVLLIMVKVMGFPSGDRAVDNCTEKVIQK